MFPVIKQAIGFCGEGAGCVLYNRHLRRYISIQDALSGLSPLL